MKTLACDEEKKNIKHFYKQIKLVIAFVCEDVMETLT